LSALFQSYAITVQYVTFNNKLYKAQIAVIGNRSAICWINVM